MAQMSCHFYSDVLQKHTAMTVIIPENTKNQFGGANQSKSKRIPVLYLLHGFTDDHTIWCRRTSIERYADEWGIAVVMPDADHSFYTDMYCGKPFFRFLTEELPEKVAYFFSVSSEPEDTYVAGLSMGGYGAFKWALSKPSSFHKAASLSGVVDIVRLRKDKSSSDMEAVMNLVFEASDIKKTSHDLAYLLEKQVENHVSLPALYLACGKEDFLYEDNQAFAHLMEKLDVKRDVTFDHGTHEWGYWDRHIEHVIEWMMSD